MCASITNDSKYSKTVDINYVFFFFITSIDFFYRYPSYLNYNFIIEMSMEKQQQQTTKRLHKKNKIKNMHMGEIISYESRFKG